MWSRTARSSPVGDDADLYAWRLRALMNAGFAPDIAAALARSTTDLHQLIELVDRGCPPSLAARIMAPLDLELPSR